MTTLFKITSLMLITSALVNAQNSPDFEMDEKHTIYKESFSTNDNTTLVLNLKSTAAQVYESTDNNVYIEYTKEFNNTGKKRIKRQLEFLEVAGKKQGNKITYSVKPKNEIRYSVYNFEDLVLERAEKKEFLKDSTIKPVIRKSLDSIFQEIRVSDLVYRNKLYGALKIKVRSPRYKKNMQFTISKMIIKIPKNVHVRATLENSNLVFFDDFNNRATMNIRNSKLRFKKVGNPLNIVDMDNGYFRALEVNTGKYSFANVRQILIGKLSNTYINSEFANAEIGEIGQGNKILDFNSKFWFYNFSKDFVSFNLNTDYTEINLFNPKDKNYYLETFGYDTVHYWNDGISGEVKSDIPNESVKMLVIGKESNPNKIQINTTHGIIRFGEDFIDFGE